METGLAIESDRVRCNTPNFINRRIDSATPSSIRHFSKMPRQAVDRRISALNDEWDIEQTLETNATTLALAGVALGATVHRKWLILSGVVLEFLLLHGIQGWCPPLPLLRKAGVRTRTEIDREKLALKYLRGDFSRAGHDRPAARIEPPQRERRRLGALVE